MTRFLLLFTIVMGLNCERAFALKVVVFTDQEGGDRAQEQLERFNTPPFNEYDIDFQVVYVPPDTMKCVVTNKPVDGMVDCDRSYINRRAQEMNADQAMVVSSAGHRGSGGSLPVVPVQRPLGSLLHEFMHTLGFDDEYCYSKELAKIYCRNDTSEINNVVIVPQNPYSNDSRARGTHSGDIPWYATIRSRTKITSQASGGRNLGTPSRQSRRTGLFESETCHNAEPPIPMWRPNSSEIVMGDMDEDIPLAMRPLVRQALERKGASKLATRFERQSTWLGLSSACYIVDVKTGGDLIERRVAGRYCNRSANRPDVLDTPRDNSDYSIDGATKSNSRGPVNNE